MNIPKKYGAGYGYGKGISRQPNEWSIEQSWAETYAKGKNGSAEIYRIALAACACYMARKKSHNLPRQKEKCRRPHQDDCARYTCSGGCNVKVAGTAEDIELVYLVVMVLSTGAG